MARPSPPRGYVNYYPRSTSPAPAQPQSKREKRRTVISDKLEAMKESFESAHQEHFYAQLSATHCDINLIMQADPHHGPLDDSPEDIARLVNEARAVVCSRSIAPEAEKSFEALGGRSYSRYVGEVNGALEQRDADLAQAYNNYQNGLTELKRTNAYRIRLAKEEAALLSRTLRDRLIQSISQKRARLLKDKEQLDIADSNALLLNPTQFSIGNPANSPGGLGANPRKTRNTRGRPGEGDGPAALSNAEANANTNGAGKRKRKAAFDDDSGSPGPPDPRNASINDARGAVSSFENGNGGSTNHSSRTFQRDGKARAAYSQFEAPLYSIDRLFSEKELLMTMNRAHVSTSDYFDRLRARGIESRLHAAVANGSSNDPKTSKTQTNNGENATDGNDGGDVAMGDDAAGPSATQPVSRNSRAPTPLPAAPTHTTRATLRSALPPAGGGASSLNPPSALDSLATLTLSNPSANTASTMPQAGLGLGGASYILPPYAIGLSTTASASKANPAAPTPGGASEMEIMEDLRLMREGIDGASYQRLAERCCVRPGEEEFGVGLGRDIASMSSERDKDKEKEKGAVREKEDNAGGPGGGGPGGGVGADGAGLGITGLGGVAMSKTNSSAGYGDGSSGGGEAMSRSASGRGQGRVI